MNLYYKNLKDLKIFYILIRFESILQIFKSIIKITISEKIIRNDEV